MFSATAQEISPLQERLAKSFTDPNDHLKMAELHDEDRVKALFSLLAYVYYSDADVTRQQQEEMEKLLKSGVKDGDNEFAIDLGEQISLDKESDNLSMVDLLIKMTVASNINGSGVSQSNYNLLKDVLEKVIGFSNDVGAKKGFYWENYIPFFQWLKRENELEVLCTKVFGRE